MIASPCLLALSLFITQLEACIPPPPPPTTTTTETTTTATPLDCPLDGKTCVGEDNLLDDGLKAADGPDACSKKTIYITKYNDS